MEALQPKQKRTPMKAATFVHLDGYRSKVQGFSFKKQRLS